MEKTHDVTGVFSILHFPFLILFFLSTVFGVWVAVDGSAAGGKLLQISVGMLVAWLLPHLLCRHPRFNLLLALLPAFIAIFFLATNHWSARLGKIALFDPLLRLLNSIQPETLRGYSVNTNVIGGILAVYLPLQIATLKPNRFRLPLVLFTVTSLVLTQSRGAWVAVASVAVVYAAWRAAQHIQPKRAKPLWLATVAGAALFAVGVFAFAPAGNRFAGALFESRQNIWADSWQLALAYPFSGIGLSSFEMAYSSYVLLVHVPFLYYAHNLFLDLWLGHGALGLLAFIAWVATAVKQTLRANAHALSIPALAAVAILLVHGMLDDVWYGYGAVALPLLFVPLGLLGATHETSSVLNIKNVLRFACGVAVCAGLLFLLIGFVPQFRSALTANRAALQQTQLELREYTNEKYGVQDALRRSGKINWQPIVDLYEQAIQQNPQNAQAHLRLGQLRLAQATAAKDYELACEHIRIAYNLAQNNRAARQIQGECLALAGDARGAAQVWRTVETDQNQLGLRLAWYNDFLADLPRAQLISAAIQAMPKE